MDSRRCATCAHYVEALEECTDYCKHAKTRVRHDIPCAAWKEAPLENPTIREMVTAYLKDHDGKSGPYLTVRKMVKTYLQDNGYDGLCFDDERYPDEGRGFHCQCSLDEKLLCDEYIVEMCRAGYRLPTSRRIVDYKIGEEGS